MSVYYNENDPKAAAWLRELMWEGHIAMGDVDERSIEDVRPRDLDGYVQCHFFAGIGGWSYALRLAGWPDDRPVWTGSCPCQPFSAAGKGAGFADERHLWPAWFHLIRQCRPRRLFGEQVANALPWFDLVQGDLEGEGYAFGGAIIGAHSVGAPHIRQRLYWVADAGGHRQQQYEERDSQPGRGIEASCGSDADGRGDYGDLEHAEGNGWLERWPESGERGTESRRAFGELADTDGLDASAKRQQRSGQHGQQQEDGCALDWLGDPRESGSRRNTGTVSRTEGSVERSVRGQLDESQPSSAANFVGHAAGERLEGRGVPAGGRENQRTAWTPSDFVWCRDGKWRPVEPGTFPLAHGVSGRVGLLRGYGNAIVPQVAAAFIEACGLI